HQTISDELKGISPLLAGIPGHTLFSVPDGYFDGLAERIMQQIRLLEQGSAQGELETIAPLLHTMSRKNVYAVPEGYFDNMVVKRPAARVMT
ncbi:hypothetical protein, partial [Klebsiella michiganensis]|uniref:hypothetical protein n=1 Tax=Klebsiella michiganensis TaxID=1134687 RepID=UPI0019533825